MVNLCIFLKKVKLRTQNIVLDLRVTTFFRTAVLFGNINKYKKHLIFIPKHRRKNCKNSENHPPSDQETKKWRRNSFHTLAVFRGIFVSLHRSNYIEMCRVWINRKFKACIGFSVLPRSGSLLLLQLIHSPPYFALLWSSRINLPIFTVSRQAVF